MVKRIMFIVLAAMILSSGLAANKITVIGKEDNLPIEGATVISSSGIILGMTDRLGNVAVNTEKDFPLDIRCIGFEPSLISVSSDTVKLTPAIYELSEITVKADARPIMKVTSYAREYCSGATVKDTLQLYAEYMLVSYGTVGDKKVKGFKGGDTGIRPIATRRFARFANSENMDSVAIPGNFDDVSYLSYYNLLLGIPYNSFPENEKIRNGQTTDTIMGKHSYKTLYKKADNLYTITYDMLADYEDHRCSPTLFKLLGMTMDISKLQRSSIYNMASDSIYTLHDFIYQSGGLHASAKGKMFKWMMGMKELDIDCYAELYPIDIEFLTIEEYKEDRKDKKGREAIPFSKPQNLQPLPTGVQRIIDRVDCELSNKR